MRPRKLWEVLRQCAFQSTHPRGVRRALAGVQVSHALFQSTHPRGVRRFVMVRVFQPLPYFNPRTHVGCDFLHSQHLPHGTYFNPRTHVGCDFSCERSNPDLFDFNPRTHVGCDLPTDWNGFGIVPISIHAPTWGATVKPSNGWLLGHKDNEFANENIIIINSVNIT